MKKTILLISLMISILSMASQEQNLVIYQNDGSEQEYKINDIANLQLTKYDPNYILKIFYEDSLVNYYPITGIDSIIFSNSVYDSITANNMDLFTYGVARTFNRNDIDSIVISRLETTISSNAVIIDSTIDDGMIGCDSSRVYLRTGSKLGSQTNIGDVMVSGINNIAPTGLLRKIISIENQNDTIILFTETAALTDVFENAIIQIRKSFSDEDTIITSTKNQGDIISGSKNGFTFGFKDVELITNIKIDGSLTINPDMGYNLIIEDRKIRQFLFQLGLESNLKLEGHGDLKTEVKLKKSLNELLGIPSIKLKPIVISAGPVPIIITSDIDFWAGCTLTMGREVRTGLNEDGNAVAGYEYNSGKWRNISSIMTKFTFKPPAFSIGGGFKLTVGPQLNMSLYGLKDAFYSFINFNVFGEIKVDFVKTPLWQLWDGIEANAGVKSNMLKEEKKLPYLVEYRSLHDQSKNQINRIEPPQAEPGDTISLKGEGFGYIQGANFIALLKDESLDNFIRALDYPIWGDKEVRVVIPGDIQAKPMKIIMNIDEIWTDLKDMNIAVTPPVISIIYPYSTLAGEDLIIKGKYFKSARDTNYVSFNGFKASDYNAWSDTVISCKVPYDANAGKLWVSKKGIKSNEVNYGFSPNLNGYVKIGDQIWTDRNLDVDHYRNGDPIPEVQDPQEWRNLTSGAWCYYNNDSIIGKTYGKLYNWYAVNDPRGLAPAGWHIPSDKEWQSLHDYVRQVYPRAFEGLILREAGNVHWKYSNEFSIATNNFGFTALPAGLRQGIFSGLTESTYFWSSDRRQDKPLDEALSRWIDYVTSTLDTYVNSFKSGLSVRCIKDD